MRTKPARCGNRRIAPPALAAALVLGAVLTAAAHGDLDLRLEEVSRRLERSPAKAELYLQRAELRRLHAEPELALVDLARARELNRTLAGLDFAEGRALLDLERWAEARSAFDQALRAEPDHPIALWFRAQALARLDRRIEADADLKRCLEVAPQPTPELYLARANNLEKAGRTNDAAAVLEQGIERLGGISSLQLARIELLARSGRMGEALSKLDVLLAAAVRKETLQLRKATLLEAAGDRTAALATYRAALNSLEALGPSTRNTVANRALTEKIKEAIQRLERLSESR
jgi:tetratricopeptide (TPR) repeat protein